MEAIKKLFKPKNQETDDPIELHRRIKANAKVAYMLLVIIVIQSIGFALYISSH